MKKTGAKLLLHRLTEKQLLDLNNAVNSAIEEKWRRGKRGREYSIPAKAVVLRVVPVEPVPAGQRTSG